MHDEGFRFNGCVFQDCRIINNRFVNCTARELILDRCALIGVIFKQLSSAGLGSPLDAATGCTLKFCQFEKMEMPKTSFRESDILECNYTECDLSGSNFSGCRMEGTELSFCNVSNADFRNSRGYIVNLKNCNAKGALFSFPEAIHLLDVFGVKIS